MSKKELNLGHCPLYYLSAHCPPQKTQLCTQEACFSTLASSCALFLNISSLQPFDASGRVLHKGTQIRSLSSFHPHSEGLGSVGLASNV